MLPLLKQTKLRNQFSFMLCLSLFATIRYLYVSCWLYIYLFLPSPPVSPLFLLFAIFLSWSNNDNEQYEHRLELTIRSLQSSNVTCIYHLPFNITVFIVFYLDVCFSESFIDDFKALWIWSRGVCLFNSMTIFKVSMKLK